MRNIILPALLIGLLSCDAQVARVSSGTLKRVENFESQFVTPRNVDVWLPDYYTPSEKYAVLYMHDGQMLFDSTTTWNKSAWEVDEVVSKLLKEKTIRDVIVVGVWSGGRTRLIDYFPQQPFDKMMQSEKDTVLRQLQRAGRTIDAFQPVSDGYLKFLVTELKPYIDQNFATHTGPENTFIMGSSMGGLISLYAICEYPDVFGGAACLSTHWPGTFEANNNPVPDSFFKYMTDHLPDPKTHKIYFDYGDQTLDAMYPALQQKADSVMQQKGYSADNWLTQYFPGENHSETAWQKRLHIPLVFLLSEKSSR